MNISLNDENLDRTVNLELYSGHRYQSLKFVAILDGHTVMQLGYDAPANHQQNIGYVPAGIVNDWKAYKYGKFFNVKNEAVYIGLPWIIPESVEETSNTPYLITVWDVDNKAINSLRAMMNANGIEKFEIKRL